MRRQLTGLPAVALVWSLISGVGPPAQAAAVECAAFAPDAAAALALAQACGVPVEVEPLRTQTGTVSVKPDGAAVVEEYGYPQRVRRPDGTWSALDPTLAANPDGTWSPRASTVDLTISGGGNRDLIRGAREGRQIRLTWPLGNLPLPVVSGDTATYPEVLPGVDLAVTAHDTGFGEVLMVKTRSAAANPALRNLVFGSQLSGMSWQAEGGGLRAVDGQSGEEILGASAPLMWDSSGDGASSADGPGAGARVAPVALSLSGNDIVLQPDAALLADQSATLPMFIDPTVTYTAWTMINQNFPNQSYWSYDKKDCPGGYNTECAKVGYVPCCAFGPEVKYRSIWRFPTSGFRDKQILSAQFTIDLLHSFSCDNSTTELRETGSISSSTTWNNHASTWSGTVTDNVSNQSCNQARKLTEFTSATLKSRLQAIANGSASNTYWGLRAANEGSSSGWKKFDAKKARLVVEVNTPPDVPANLTVDAKACATGANRSFVKTATPSLRARLTDDDGHTMTGSFEWAPVSADGTKGTISTLSQTGVPHGGTALKTMPSRPDGRYAFRAYASDSRSTGAKSGWCDFEVDTVKPAVPTVTADVYAEGSAGCPNGACGTVGMTGQFTFASASTDTHSYRWGFSDPPSTVATPEALGGSVIVKWTPTAAGPHTLFVKAVDRAGNEAVRVYQFTVAQPTIALARWKMNDAPGSTSLADDTGQGRTIGVFNGATLGVPGRLAAGNDGIARTAMGFDGADDRAESTGWVIADTSKSFSVAAWVKLDETGAANQHIVSQQGVAVGAFYLEYHGSGVWRLTLPVTDTSSPTYQNVSATVTPRAGVWTHVAATYDTATNTARIYVNGVLEGTATGITAFKGIGKLRIGGTSWPLKGSLGEVQVWNRMITASEVFNLVDPIQVGKVAEWRLEEVGPGPAFDGSGMLHDLTFFNGAHIPPTGAGKSGTGLRLDGIDDYAAPDEPVLRTDQSFTVSVWARPRSTTDMHIYLAQESVPGGAPGFLVYYDPANTLWKFKVYPSAALDEAGVTIATAPATTPTSYHHLVGVFDAQKRELRFYVDGVLAMTKPLNAAYQPWNSTGRFLIGRDTGVKYAHADLDEIRVYQGAVADITRIG